MEYLVCIKQVPQVSKIKMDENNNLIRDGVKSIINPADLNALTCALKLRDKTGGRVSILTMGPPSADEALRECIAMGADRGFIISSRDFKGSDTLATSYTLSKGIEHLGKFDMIFTGTRTIDGDTGQVGPEIAENLNINQVGYVKEIDFLYGKIIATRETEDEIQVVEAKIPALISVIRNSNNIIKPSKESLEKTKNMKFEILGPEDISADSSKIGVKGSFTEVFEVFAPKEEENDIIIQGKNERDKVDKLVRILQEKTTIGW